MSVHCRWPLIRGTDGHVEMSRDIDNVAVHSRWPLMTGVAQGRYYCRSVGELLNDWVAAVTLSIHGTVNTTDEHFKIHLKHHVSRHDDVSLSGPT